MILTPKQASTLEVFGDGPVHNKTLVTRHHVCRSTLRALERRGLVEQDRAYFQITEAGRSLRAGREPQESEL